MAAPGRGSVVVVDFLFTDRSGSKLRPALVVAKLIGDDVILCPISSSRRDIYSIALHADELIGGTLRRDSFIRPNLLMTTESKIILRKIGEIAPEKMRLVIDRIVNILTE